jgi:hypothetical protein
MGTALQGHVLTTGDNVTADGCITSLFFISSLIRLPAAVLEEAATQPMWEYNLSVDGDALRSFCDTCGSMLGAAAQVMQLVCALHQQQEKQQQQGMVAGSRNSSSQAGSSQQACQDCTSTGAQPHHSQQQEDRSSGYTIDQDAAVLLPVLAASALQLLHTTTMCTLLSNRAT